MHLAGWNSEQRIGNFFWFGNRKIIGEMHIFGIAFNVAFAVCITDILTKEYTNNLHIFC